LFASSLSVHSFPNISAMPSKTKKPTSSNGKKNREYEKGAEIEELRPTDGK